MTDRLNLPRDNQASLTPTTFNITLATVDTEFSQLLPEKTRKFTLESRSNDDFRFAFVTGKVATPTAPYKLLKAGLTYFDDVLRLNSTTIYLASSVENQVIEIIAWK